ncbi:acylneuraminate cytidylyltransferase family protein [Fulvivirga sp.]|jgi:CMP-N,N'-diacetyllegionaminic acid synthase|uniref:acylneuraminate cytidylyltransferase family protein n=1 Tax=Fulvivirga sp. TaxID=1931237 RepID=UPI0032EB0089
MNILLTICARGGSKGIPGKNIKPLNGVPLIGYSIKMAQKIAAKLGGQLALSTDSDEIRNAASQFGLNTDYNRPESLSGDSAGKIDVIHHLITYMEDKANCEFDYIIDLDVTSPMRTLEDIEKAFDKLKGNKEALNIFSVSPASRNPYFNMVEVNDTGYAEVVKKTVSFKSRQSAPKVYDMNASFYIYRRKFFKDDHRISTTDKSLAFVMDHHCFDIDHLVDFTIMDIMMRENLLGFEI